MVTEVFKCAYVFQRRTGEGIQCEFAEDFLSHRETNHAENLVEFINDNLQLRVITSGVTRAQFSGGTRGCTTFSRGAYILYPAASNGDLFFQNSEWGGAHGGHVPSAGGNVAPVHPP